ncbi:MAG: alpha/beta hydrolase [Planctomycetales bacterium]|nr:alpha/beta hydrolase [Planctomycetales bacterium]MCA9225159.1 alpha/beta hydrolase [Planctomycetales bacterium]
MPLDPHVKRWLDEVYGGPFTPMHEMTIDQARRQMQAASDLLGPGEEVASVENIAADGPHGSIPVRIYRPRSQHDRLPLLVYFHGGGWVLGSIATHDAYCRALANASGWAVASVDYRLAPEHPFPAAFDDSYAAAAWLADSADRLNLDERTIAVGGDSAGGNLAAAVALAARDRGGPRLAGQLLIYPITDFDLQRPSYIANADGYHLTRETMRWFWQLYCGDNFARVADDLRASPLRAESLAELPPAFVLTAEFDPLLDEGAAYAAKLSASGVEARHKRYDGMIHGFVRRTAEWSVAREALRDAAEFLRSLS